MIAQPLAAGMPAAARGWRRAACSVNCRRERVVVIGGADGRQGAQWREYHDVWAHDHYRTMHLASLSTAIVALLAMVPPDRRAFVRTGRLVVDFTQQRALVDGVARQLGPSEWVALAYLARRVGTICRREDLYAAVWPDGLSRRKFGEPLEGGADRFQVLRALLGRLRGALGPAGGLIETLKETGYRLRAAPPDGSDGEA